jgi:hypothetical protein
LASNVNLPEELMAQLRRLAGELPGSGSPGPSVSQPNIAAVLEFIRMLETPGPNDHHVLSFIRNHLFDPELRAQRRPRIG